MIYNSPEERAAMDERPLSLNLNYGQGLAIVTALEHQLESGLSHSTYFHELYGGILQEVEGACKREIQSHLREHFTKEQVIAIVEAEENA